MSKLRTTLAALAAAAAFGPPGGAAAAVVTLDLQTLSEPAGFGGSVRGPDGAVLQREDGYTVTATGGGGGSLNAGLAALVFGSNHMLVQGGAAGDRVGFTVVADDGSAFDLLSFDVGPAFGFGGFDFTLEYEALDGTVATMSFAGSALQALTVNLTDLVRVSFLGGNAVSVGGIDNLVLRDAAVPLPGALLLFGPGALGLGLMRRRANA